MTLPRTELELSSLPVPGDWPLGEAILNLTGLKRLGGGDCRVEICA